MRKTARASQLRGCLQANGIPVKKSASKSLLRDALQKANCTNITVSLDQAQPLWTNAEYIQWAYQNVTKIPELGSQVLEWRVSNIANCYANDTYCLTKLHVRSSVLRRVYSVVEQANRVGDWSSGYSDGVLLKGLVAATILRAQRVPLNRIGDNFMILPKSDQAYSDEIQAVMNIADKHLRPMNVPLTYQQYLINEATFAARGLPTILLIVDCLVTGDGMTVIGSDGNGTVHWEEASTATSETAAFLGSDLFGHIKAGTMGWPKLFKVMVQGTYVYLPGCLCVDAQIFKGLDLPPELRAIVRGPMPWLSADEFRDIRANGHNDTRDFGLYSAFLSRGRLIAECPLGAMTRRFNLDHPARGCDSTTQLDFTVKLHCLINDLGDLHPTVLTSSSIPETCMMKLEETLARTEAEHTGLLECAWVFAHNVRQLELPKGRYVRDAQNMGNMVLGQPQEQHLPAMTEEMMATMLRLVGQGPESE